MVVYSSVNATLFLVICAAFLALPLMIGIYVFRDAKRRGMNEVLWTLVAVLAPGFIGLIIYLLVRSNYSDMTCTQCGTKVREDYIVCPGCGTKLRPTCPSCAKPVEMGWKVCPSCATPLPEEYDDVVTPKKKKDKTLWKILVALILIPVILIGILAVSFSFYSHETAGKTQTYAEENLGWEE